MSHNESIDTELTFVGTGKLDNGKTIEIHFKTDNLNIERQYLVTPRLIIDPIFDEESKTFFKLVEKSDDMGLKTSDEIKDYSHLKKVIFTLHNIMSYDDKEKLISALTSNGYVVGAELIKDKNTFVSQGWKIDIYE